MSEIRSIAPLEITQTNSCQLIVPVNYSLTLQVTLTELCLTPPAGTPLEIANKIPHEIKMVFSLMEPRPSTQSNLQRAINHKTGKKYPQTKMSLLDWLGEPGDRFRAAMDEKSILIGHKDEILKGVEKRLFTPAREKGWLTDADFSVSKQS